MVFSSLNHTGAVVVVKVQTIDLAHFFFACQLNTAYFPVD